MPISELPTEILTQIFAAADLEVLWCATELSHSVNALALPVYLSKHGASAVNILETGDISLSSRQWRSIPASRLVLLRSSFSKITIHFELPASKENERRSRISSLIRELEVLKSFFLQTTSAKVVIDLEVFHWNTPGGFPDAYLSFKDIGEWILHFLQLITTIASRTESLSIRNGCLPHFPGDPYCHACDYYASSHAPWHKKVDVEYAGHVIRLKAAGGWMQALNLGARYSSRFRKAKGIKADDRVPYRVPGDVLKSAKVTSFHIGSRLLTQKPLSSWTKHFLRVTEKSITRLSVSDLGDNSKDLLKLTDTLYLPHLTELRVVYNQWEPHLLGFLMRHPTILNLRLDSAWYNPPTKYTPLKLLPNLVSLTCSVYHVEAFLRLPDALPSLKVITILVVRSPDDDGTTEFPKLAISLAGVESRLRLCELRLRVEFWLGPGTGVTIPYDELVAAMVKTPSSPLNDAVGVEVLRDTRYRDIGSVPPPNWLGLFPRTRELRFVNCATDTESQREYSTMARRTLPPLEEVIFE